MNIAVALLVIGIIIALAVNLVAGACVVLVAIFVAAT